MAYASAIHIALVFFLSVLGKGVVRWPIIALVLAAHIILVAYAFLGRRAESIFENFSGEYYACMTVFTYPCLDPTVQRGRLKRPLDHFQH